MYIVNGHFNLGRRSKGILLLAFLLDQANIDKIEKSNLKNSPLEHVILFSWQSFWVQLEHVNKGQNKVKREFVSLLKKVIFKIHYAFFLFQI